MCSVWHVSAYFVKDLMYAVKGLDANKLCNRLYLLVDIPFWLDGTIFCKLLHVGLCIKRAAQEILWELLRHNFLQDKNPSCCPRGI